MFRERTQHSVTFNELQKSGLSTDPSAYSTAEAALPVLKLSSGDLGFNFYVEWRELYNFKYHSSCL